MNETVRMENKKEDKKFLGKFLLILACAFVVGIGLGIGMAFMKNGDTAIVISDAVYGFAMRLTPFVSITFSLLIAILLIYAKVCVRKRIQAWDGEEEEEYKRIDTILGNILYIISIGTVVTYFFFGFGFDCIGERKGWQDICYFFGFILSMVLIIVGQQMIINLTKEMNPEKKGSVYDVKFVNKWEDSCDEAEKILIYKSAYRTYVMMNQLFVGLWIFTIFGNHVFGFGVMPLTMVSLIWLCQIALYTHYTKYYSKYPEKIGVFK